MQWPPSTAGGPKTMIQGTSVMHRPNQPSTSVRKVLLADDDRDLRHVIRVHLEEAGFDVVTAQDGAAALDLIREDFAAVVLDLKMPRASGLDILREVRARVPDCPVIMISGQGGIPDAVESMRQGAHQFLAKPFRPEELVAAVRQVVRSAALEEEANSLRQALRTPMRTSSLVAHSPAMHALKRQAERAAALDATALITGASGTGKSTLARLMHQLGPRSGGPFISVSCASLPRDLIEAELFGHERGAFTGAVAARPGRAEMAEGGTLFLDEIGDMPLDLQPKLLTFLQEREVQRIGGKRPRKVDVRVIAATHLDLEQMVRDRSFREDLYFRLNVLRLDMPTLAERREDMPELIATILQRIGKERGGYDFVLTPAAEGRLVRHEWRGNLRELENVLERTTAFCHGTLIDEHMLALDHSRSTCVDPGAQPDRPHLAGYTMEQIERWALIDTLDSVGGNKAAAARALGVCEKTIYNKLKRVRLQDRHAPRDEPVGLTGRNYPIG